MRLASVATVFLGALAFVAGLLLISIGTGLWIVTYYTIGFYESLPLMALGGLFIFIAMPTVMFGFDSLHRWFVASSSSLSSEKAADDELLFSNKRIVGVSLVFTGAIWLCASVVSFWASYGRIMTCVSCPANFSSSIFSTNYLDYWIPIVIGAIILEIGAILLGLSIFEKRASQISSTERTTMEINRSGRTRRFIVPRWL